MDVSLFWYSVLTPCNSSPCLNGGACIVGAGGLSYSCGCQQGFLGANCERGTYFFSCDNYYNNMRKNWLKAPDTFGNRWRPVYSHLLYPNICNKPICEHFDSNWSSSFKRIMKEKHNFCLFFYVLSDAKKILKTSGLKHCNI